uniref:Protein SAAL1 n=1 Tax=Echinococcus granulosus TaxID=6210 RepID=A0A068WCL4_ECHGR|nr:protein SAAL1 [Echinococcus granulosus]
MRTHFDAQAVRFPSIWTVTTSTCSVFLQQNDQIGNSAYSKRWLYSLILQVLTKISESEEGSFATEEELESPLEEELCCLWDITTDQALLSHLRHFQLVPVFTECIHKSKCPRLIEISLGVLANLSLDEEQCGILSEEQSFMVDALNLLVIDDTRILIELFRLLRSVLASRLHRQVWLDAIHFALEFIDRVNFILCSSTNASLLMNTISAIETILRIDDSLCELWCNESLLGSLQEAQKQMCWIHGDEVEIIYRLLYLYSTNSTGVRTLMSRYQDIYPSFGVLMRKICEDEPHLIPFEKYIASLRLILPVIDVILTNLPSYHALKTFSCDKDILPCLFQISFGCVSRSFISGDLSLDDLWKDLSVLFGDLIQRVHEYIQDGGYADKPPEDSGGLLYWLHDIEDGNQDLREAFVRCCLCRRAPAGVADAEGNAAVEVLRGHLVFVCQRLCLSKLLECSTTDHS